MNFSHKAESRLRRFVAFLGVQRERPKITPTYLSQSAQTEVFLNAAFPGVPRRPVLPAIQERSGDILRASLGIHKRSLCFPYARVCFSQRPGRLSVDNWDAVNP